MEIGLTEQLAFGRGSIFYFLLFPTCTFAPTSSKLYLSPPPRIGYVICETQYRMKTWGPLSKNH